MIAVLAFMGLGYWIPQRGTPRSSRLLAAKPELAASLDRLGLDELFQSPVFAGMLIVSVVLIVTVMARQTRVAWRRTFRAIVPASDLMFVAEESPDEIDAYLRSERYRKARVVQGQRRYVRQLWGLWAGVILHAGLVLVILASMLVLATERRAVVDIAVGEMRALGQADVTEVGGPLSSPFSSRAALTVEQVRPEFWPTDELKQVTSTLRFEGDDGAVADVQVNGPVRHNGVTFYQDQSVGYALLMEVERDGQVDRVRIDVPWPHERSAASGGSFGFSSETELQVRLYADARREAMIAIPEVVARFVERGQPSKSESLPIGESVQVGTARVTLVDAPRWTRLILVQSKGIPALFAGFLLVVIGSTLYYTSAPREVYVREDEAGSVLTWRSLRYRDDDSAYDRLVSGLKRRRLQ